MDSRLVLCKSVNSLRTIEDAITSSVDNIIDQHTFFTDDEKHRVRERFREIFLAQLHERVQIDGQSWAAAQENGNKTQEMEPVDEQVKGQLNAVVHPALRNQMVETTNQRQQCPAQCRELYAKQCRAECQTLDRISAEPQTDDLVPESSAAELNMQNEVTENAQDTRQVTKSISCVLDNAKETYTVLKYPNEM